MKKLELNIWQKIGIVLSILWIVFTWVNETNKIEKSANDFANFSYKVCSDTQRIRHDNDLSSCDLKKQKDLLLFSKNKNLNAGIASLLPLPFFWLLIFIFYYFFKSTLIGYQQLVVWKRMPKLKKIFTVFCLTSFGFVILFSILVVLNYYVDSKVPVTLSSFVDVDKYDYDKESIANASGTWTGNGVSEFMGSKIQTSTIKCIKSKLTCWEARAYVPDNSNALMRDLIEYEVTQWTDSSVRFKNENLCYEELFTMDLITNKVSGIGKYTDKNEYCKKTSHSDKTWDYQLSDGFKVYWEERQKARPWLMRVIQSFFGN